VAPTLSSNKTETIDTESGFDWQGEGVTIAQVLSALSTIRRRFAQKDAANQDHPHPRNCVMTLVAIASTDAEERRALRAAMAIAAHHPSFAVVVRDQPHFREGRIDATITTHTQQPASASPVQFELARLHVRGAAGKHLAALVDPLLLSGVPTYLWWLGTPPFGTKELTDAVRICDALVVDSAHFDRPFHAFLGFSALTMKSHERLGLADFQWTRLAPWRESIAQFFAPADRRPFLKGMGEIGVDYAGEGRGNRIAAALLIGWFGSALGWRLQRAVGGSGGVVAAQFAAEGWRTVDVAFRSVPKAHLALGEVAAVRIRGTAGGRTFQLTIERDPERRHQSAPEAGGRARFQRLHPAGGEDDAGMEIAHRTAAWHRETALRNLDTLHHTATGDAPGESVPRNPTVIVRERRRANVSKVLLAMIDIGGAPTLRHVQRLEPQDEVSLLMHLLSSGTHDHVYVRSLVAAAELMKSL
jgi:glucose-6-phosphate dehydrogenase assembly protein OpcA